MQRAVGHRHPCQRPAAAFAIEVTAAAPCSGTESNAAGSQAGGTPGFLGSLAQARVRVEHRITHLAALSATSRRGPEDQIKGRKYSKLDPVSEHGVTDLE